MEFNDRDYTRDAIIKQVGLIELHCKDGSAVDAGCQCIDTKHLYLIEGLAEEGIGFALSAKERRFYTQLADLVRLIRKNMEVEKYELHGVMRQVMQKEHPVPLFKSSRPVPVSSVPNPYPGKYLPSRLTACEKKYSSVRSKLASCIRQVEAEGEAVNPVAVCRASIPCPP